MKAKNILLTIHRFVVTEFVKTCDGLVKGHGNAKISQRQFWN